MHRQLLGVALVGLLLASMGAGVGAAQESVRGEPELAVYAPDATLTPGSTTELTLQIANDGEVRSGAGQRELVTTARSVTVAVESDDAPLVVETGRQSVGSIADGAVREVPIAVTVPADVEPDTYTLDVELEYSYTGLVSQHSGVVQERSESVTESVDVDIDDGPRFALRTVESDLQVGGSGTLVAELTNVGGEPARDVGVELAARSESVTLGGGSTDTAWVAGLAPGETATLAYDVALGPGAAGVALTGTVDFTGPAGVTDRQDGLPVGVQPTEQAFTLAVEESTLRVGESGVIRATITNDGPAAVDDVVVALGEGRLDARSATVALGDLDVGETATVAFRGTVPGDADAVAQSLDVTTRYRTAADAEGAVTDTIRVDVADRRDAVAVSAVDATFAAGEDGVLELSVTNQRDVMLQDVRLVLGVAPPLDSEFTTTVVPSLAPGETAAVAVDLEVDGDAPPTRFPATVAINYTDADGVRAAAPPATVAVTVVESAGGGLGAEVVIFGLLLVVVVAGGWWYYRR